MKKLITDINVQNKSVLFRADFNVPLENGTITDTLRIDSTLPSIDYLLKNNAKIVIMSHLGRPEGYDKTYSLKPVFNYLKTIYKNNIFFAGDVAGEESEKLYNKLKFGQILLMENIRFDEREEAGDEDFAKQLSKFGEIFVNDAFATAHRKHASTYFIAKLMPSVCGFLMGKEVNGIKSIIDNPAKPYIAVVGGAKVKDKVKMLTALAKSCDALLVGGAMAQTFLKAKDVEIGESKFDSEGKEEAKYVIELMKNQNKTLLLPTDFVCTDENQNIVKTKTIKKTYKVFDIGEQTIKAYEKVIKSANTLVMNGPMGMFEDERFAEGTKRIVQAICSCKAKTLVGGGDSASAVKEFGEANKITHLSTGGGASLKMLEGSELACVSVLQDKE